eukprot:12953464-Alexandrium_andersonii.AAC.1
MQSTTRPRPIGAATRLNPQPAENATSLQAFEPGTARAQARPRNRSPKLPLRACVRARARAA